MIYTKGIKCKVYNYAWHFMLVSGLSHPQVTKFTILATLVGFLVHCVNHKLVTDSTQTQMEITLCVSE